MIISSVYMLLQLNSCLISEMDDVSEMTTRLSAGKKVAELHKVNRKPLVMVEILMFFFVFSDLLQNRAQRMKMMKRSPD